MRVNLAAQAANDDREVEVLEDNVLALEVFLACRTQWRIVPFGGRCGLDYPAVQTVMALMRVDDTAEAFGKVRVLEAAALEVWRERDEKERRKQQRNTQHRGNR